MAEQTITDKLRANSTLHEPRTPNEGAVAEITVHYEGLHLRMYYFKQKVTGTLRSGETWELDEIVRKNEIEEEDGELRKQDGLEVAAKHLIREHEAISVKDRFGNTVAKLEVNQ